VRTFTPEEARSRAARDGEGAAAINASGYPVRITGFHSARDARAARNEVPLMGFDDPPTVFRMECRFATLTRPGVPLRGATYVVDTNAGGDYPGSEPVSQIVSTPVPFAPHIGTSGSVCHGHFVWVPWRTQLPDYLAQLCRLLNYDEPPPAGAFSAMNPAAVQHWATLGHRPLDPSLGSPVITLGAPAARRVMRRSDGRRADVPGARRLRKAA
jgi:hypothetical protein